MRTDPRLNDLHEIADHSDDLGSRVHAAAIHDVRELKDDSNLRVVVFGEFGVGKSTLINALLGRNVLPAKAMPTTGQVTRIRFGILEAVHVTMTDGRRESYPLEQINSFVTLDEHSRAREGVECIDVVVNSPYLRDGLILIDTPGINNLDILTLRAERAVRDGDLVLVVLRAAALLTSKTRRAVAWISEELGKPVLPILIGLNFVEPQDQDQLRHMIFSWANSSLKPLLGKPLLEMNATGALRYGLRIDGAEPPSDDFFALQAVIKAFKRDSPRELQKVSRKNQLGINEMGTGPHLHDLREIADRSDDLGGRIHAQAIRDVCELMDDSNLRVVVFGEFSVGKSTLINALLGRNALPAKAMPTTGHATRIRFGLSEGVHVTLTDGRKESCPLEQINSFVTLDMQSRAREGVESIEVVVNSRFLYDGLTLIDTPGVNDSDTQTVRAERAVRGSDVVLVVLRADQMLGSEIRQRAAVWMAQELGKPVVPILNCLNLVEQNDQGELRRVLVSWAKSSLSPLLGKPFFEVNAIGALRYVVKIEGAERPTDDFFALQAAIEALKGDSGREIQKVSRTNQLRAVLRSANEWNESELKQLSDAETALQDRRRRQSRHLQQSIEMLRGRSKTERIYVQSLVSRELSQGWDRLAARLASKGKDELSQKSRQWFDRYLRDAVRAAEMVANQRLIPLAAEMGVPQPDLLTLSQLIDLNQRAEVQLASQVNRSAVRAGAWGGAVTGAAMGSMIPIVGTFFGAVIGYVAGSSIAGQATKKEPDYVAAYTTAARTDWSSVTPNIESAVIEQYTARFDGILNCLQQQMADLERMPTASTELTLRRKIQSLISQVLEPLGKAPARTETNAHRVGSKWPN